MLGPITGSILLLFGGVIIGYTLYSMLAGPPVSTADWVFDGFYIVSGAINMYYGYQILYPPSMFANVVGGRRRW
jgi:hypothetical protein